MELKKLKEYEGEGSFITVKTTEAWLVKENGRWIFDLKISPESEICTSLRERENHFKSYSSDWIEQKIDLQKRINRGELKIKKIRVADRDHPLEMVGGVACLVLEIESELYCVNSLRDIYPKGWLLPGGTSDNLWEISHPANIAYRELWEEIEINGRKVLIDNNKTPFLRKSGAKLSQVNFLHHIGNAQNIIVREKRNGTYNSKGLQGTEIASLTKNVTVGINSEIGTVTICAFPKIKFPGSIAEINISDKEKNIEGRPLQRPVRLVNIRNGITSAIFLKGKNILLKENEDILKENLDVLNASWSSPLMRDFSNIYPYIL